MPDDEENEDEAPASDPGYESGPFCRHFHDPSDCDVECANCPHPCRRHGADGECLEDGCDCTWEEEED